MKTFYFVVLSAGLMFALGCQSGNKQPAAENSASVEAQPTAAKATAAKPASMMEPANQQAEPVSAKKESSMSSEVAMFGAGCFWGVEAKFRKIEGVTATEVGYAGGERAGVTYKEVCSDTTGHAEVVKVTFDPTKVSYRQLIDVFFESHDPTQLNRQGPDYGSQYRSSIFFTTDDQEKVAAAALVDWENSGKFPRSIVTKLEKELNYTKAEEYHQQYLAKRGMDTCATTIGK